MSIPAIDRYLNANGLSLSHPARGAKISNAARQIAPFPPTADAVVTLSSAAKRLATGDLPGWVDEKAERLRGNPDQVAAMREVEGMATLSRGPLVAIHEGPLGPFYTYTHTGELVTPESSAHYAAIEAASIAETARIFAAGKAKGNSAAEIFTEIQEHMATLPEDYLRQINWFRSTVAIGDDMSGS